MSDEAYDLEFLAARFYIYKLAHVVLSAEPSEALLDALTNADTVESIDILVDAGYQVNTLNAFIKDIQEQANKDSRLAEIIHAAHNQLFVVPSEQSVKLYESVYAQQMNTLFGPTTVDMRRYLREAGLASGAEGNFPEDYLPLMLDFMATLAQRSYELATIENANDMDVISHEMSQETVQEQLQNGFATQLAFEKDHLGSWLQKVANELEEKDQSRFYHEFIKALIDVIGSDKAWLESKALSGS